MKIHRISNGEMPPANKYVLIYVPDRPWCDYDDPTGVFWKVAKCIYGISEQERYYLRQSDKLSDTHRALLYKCGDEGGNNKKPYEFVCWGPDSYKGQEVDIWCELPVAEE